MTIFGCDYLGGKHFQKAMIQNHPAGWSAGIFLRTFGDARKTVEAMVKSEKFSHIVVHLAPFDNSHKYPISKLKPQLKKDLKWINDLPFTVWPSFFCEHNHSSKVISDLYEELHNIAPMRKYVNSIWKGGESGNMITEVHIPSSKQLPKKPKQPYLISFDGFGGDGSGNFTDTDIETILNKYSDAISIRWWDFKCNGKMRWDDKTPVSQRKYWPDKHYLLTRHQMMKQREGVVSWPKTALYKPSSDYHIGGSNKDGKAMVILPVKKASVQVRDSAGNVIDQMQRFQPDFEGPPKGARYYSQKYSYQIADAARAKTGSSLIKIDDMPATDGNLRSGLFR